VDSNEVRNPALKYMRGRWLQAKENRETEIINS